MGGTTNRGYSFLDLKLDHTFKSDTKVVLSGILEHSDILVDIELKSSEQSQSNAGNSQDEPREITKRFEKKTTKVRPKELYIKQDFFKISSLSYGYQKVVLGQFEPFSPSNFAMPWNLSSLAVGLNKVDNTLSQEAATIDLYPTSQVQLSFYYFPKLTYDPLITEELNDILAEQEGKVESEKAVIALPKGPDAAQNMVRFMLYPSWGTIGFTYYNGYHSSFPAVRAKIKEKRHLNGDGTLSWRDYEKYNEMWSFAKNEMFSFEMAVPVGRFTWKLEYARHSDLTDLSSSAYNARGKHGSAYSGKITPEADELFRAIRDINDGNVAIPFTRDIAALGFTADLEKWYINFMLLHMGERFEGNAKKLKDLEKKAKQSGQNDDDGDDDFLVVMPGLVASRYLDSNRENKIGLGFGMIGPGFGLLLFYNKQTDSFSYGAGIQAISYLSNESIEESLPEGYELSNEMTAGAMFNISYNF
ncbi:MAG: hypothetical protein OXB88_08395 [Bacteriovoracales bacterium]|nr:hypothetical protein [Bacteriovoracales bacterium]